MVSAWGGFGGCDQSGADVAVDGRLADDAVEGVDELPGGQQPPFDHEPIEPFEWFNPVISNQLDQLEQNDPIGGTTGRPTVAAWKQRSNATTRDHAMTTGTPPQRPRPVQPGEVARVCSVHDHLAKVCACYPEQPKPPTASHPIRIEHMRNREL